MPRVRPQEPPQLAERRITLADERVSEPYVFRTYLAPEREPGNQAEAAALTAWLSAQDLNPASPACGAAVKRLAKSVAESAVIRSTGTVPAPPPAPAAGDEVPVPPKK